MSLAISLQHRLDALKRKCITGYGCGSSCISLRKECRTTPRSAIGKERMKRLLKLAAGGASSQRDISPVRHKEAGELAGGVKSAGDGGYKGYRIDPPSNPAYQGGNAEVAKVTKALRDRIGKLEPAATRQMIDIAESQGAKLEGLAFRLKTENSLGRKIENEYKLKPFDGDIQACADSMSDVVRYTMKTTNEKYTDMVESTVKKFESEGWNARVKNYWEAGQPYRGLNIALTSPDGLKVELQLHTPQSLYVKHKTHPLYESYRVEKDNGKRRQLFDRMLKITDSMIPPWGAAKVGGVSRAPSVQRVQMKAGREKLRLMGIGQRKVLGFQTAEEAGLV
jgi:hypothetical protein